MLKLAPLFALLLAAPVAVADTVVAPPRITTLEEIVVAGELPGPGLWRIENGANALWVLGTVSPLPRNMDWRSAEVEKLIAQSAAVLEPAGSDADISAGDVFRMATLARSAQNAMRLPDGDRLADVLPTEARAQWLAAVARFPVDDKTQRLRPMFASQELYYDAIVHQGMTRVDVVWNRVQEIAEAASVPVVETRIEFPLALDRAAYKAGIAALAESRIDEMTCFTQTLVTLDGELQRMRDGAIAWATGDLETLRALRHLELQPPCKPVYDQAMGFQRRPAVDQQAANAWVAAAEAALRDNPVTFAVLPMREVVAVDGMVATLREHGFRVVAPDEAESGGVSPPE